MSLRVVAATALFVSTLVANGQQQPMSHEEEVVRIAYAKLSYATQIGMLWHAVSQHEGWPGLG